MKRVMAIPGVSTPEKKFAGKAVDIKGKRIAIAATTRVSFQPDPR